ncbi:hypothetical protein [Pseudolysobacter antarcticus]|nr:hypothetical protein [Pseudolysobacter antarcticus]
MTSAIVGPTRVKDITGESARDRLLAFFELELDRLAGIRQQD